MFNRSSPAHSGRVVVVVDVVVDAADVDPVPRLVELVLPLGVDVVVVD
jgi:hypothetical protein